RFNGKASGCSRHRLSQRRRLGRFRRCCRFRSFHLAFWLLLSFARDALVHLNAIVSSVAVAVVSERSGPPLSSTTGRDLSSTPRWSAGADDQLTNAVACRPVRCRRYTENKSKPRGCSQGLRTDLM